MNLALSESLGQELRLAKRINSNGVTKLKLWSNKVWMQVNRFLPHQLLPNTHMLSILLMQCLRVKLMHKNWVWKGIWSKCELACNADEDDSHSKLLIDLLVTLGSIYRKQAIVTTHKQSLKRSERLKKTIRKTSKPSK